MRRSEVNYIWVLRMYGYLILKVGFIGRKLFPSHFPGLTRVLTSLKSPACDIHDPGNGRTDRDIGHGDGQQGLPGVAPVDTPENPALGSEIKNAGLARMRARLLSLSIPARGPICSQFLPPSDVLKYCPTFLKYTVSKLKGSTRLSRVSQSRRWHTSPMPVSLSAKPSERESQESPPSSLFDIRPRRSPAYMTCGSKGLYRDSRCALETSRLLIRISNSSGSTAPECITPNPETRRTKGTFFIWDLLFIPVLPAFARRSWCRVPRIT